MEGAKKRQPWPTVFAADLSTMRGRAKAWSNSVLVDHAFFRVLWHNFAVVEPGVLYRANHPTPGQLAVMAQRHGIRTVINLRGARACGSDALSRDAALRLGLVQIDMALESRGAPQVDRILRLAEIFRTMTAPALMHCKSGADRAGLMSVLYRHVREGVPIAEAKQQLSLRYGHIRQGDTGILDAFFERYLADTATEPMPFYDWVETRYDPDELKRTYLANGWANRLVNNVLRRE